MIKTQPITPVQYKAFQEAYDVFNRELFGKNLPHVLVTLQRKSGARGYFSPQRFHGRTVDTIAHELAMNPDTFIGRTDEEVLSTLAHEMVHVWQQACGTPPRRSYHDRQWAAKMKEIGLQPTSTGAAGGRETGQRMTHLIIPGAAYAKAYAKLKDKGFVLPWQSTYHSAGASAQTASKTKFTCPACQQNAWAKPTAQIACYACYEGTGVVQAMVQGL